MRLGDLDYAQKQLTIAEVECRKNFQTDCNHVRDFLNALPTIDAVPVVRCQNCKHGDLVMETDEGIKHMVCKLQNWWVNPGFFCANGKRKDGEG